MNRSRVVTADENGAAARRRRWVIAIGERCDELTNDPQLGNCASRNSPTMRSLSIARKPPPLAPR